MPSIDFLTVSDAGTRLIASTEYNRFVCGTRSIEPAKPLRVVCATCGAGGTVAHRTREEAAAACVRDSGRPCLTCGAR